MSPKKKKKKKVFTFKRVSLTVLALALASTLAFGIYFVFFKDATLLKLGYTYKQINSLYKYDIVDKVTDYNQSLIYALDSKKFKEENLDYYLLFDSKMDLTVVCNELADKYSVEEVKLLASIVSEEQLYDISYNEKLKDVNSFKQLLELGYPLEQSVQLTNSVPDESIKSFISLGLLSEPTSYLSYLKTGYTDSQILFFHKVFSDDLFNKFSKVELIDQLDKYTSEVGFDIKNLPRYLMYSSKNPKKTASAVITEVNSGKDIIKAANINYSSFYKNQQTVTDTTTLTYIVSKVSVLPEEFVPSSLSNITPEYRYDPNNQMLVEEVVKAFEAMANDAKQQGLNLIAYNNYVSYRVQNSQYSTALLEFTEQPEYVDTYLPKAGCSEHQTGLAIDIADKSERPENLSEASYNWLKENGYKYGFIERYIVNHEWITGLPEIHYHYRYVGVDAATIIHEMGWTLEEYNLLFNK